LVYSVDNIGRLERTGAKVPQLIRIEEASEVTGVPVSTLRKSFMRTPPRNVPPPPPHRRIGRSVYILADKLESWVLSLPAPAQVKKRGRPTKAETISRRDQ
jgi:hypothetical protein